MNNSARASKTHCLRGHPFDEENTYVADGGNRKCRACNRARHQANRENRRIKKHVAISRVSSPGLAEFARLPCLI